MAEAEPSEPEKGGRGGGRCIRKTGFFEKKKLATETKKTCDYATTGKTELKTTMEQFDRHKK